MKNSILFLSISLFLASCSSKVSIQSDLELLKVVSLNIAEPSGITIFQEHLYIVSDHKGTYYKTTLEGKIVKKYKTKFSDLEGITYNSVSHNFLLVNESKRTLVVLDSLGNLVRKIKIKGKQTQKNNGLEGVCYVEDKEMIVVVNESAPIQLVFLNLKGEILLKKTLTISKDISGICYEKETNSFWIVSDESESIYHITTKGKLLKSYKIPVKKAEGIVTQNNIIYIVSDSSNKLYSFKKSD